MSMGDLFSQRAAGHGAQAPLAARMRPRSLEEVVGQSHLVGPGAPLRRALEQDQLPSLILYGPPGSGKTTIAQLVARITRSHFEPLNAVTSGVADLRRVIQEARERRNFYGKRTILFIDEIHRFNKAQQDALLAAVEDGTLTLIGATTENPFHSVTAPLVSRAQVLQLEPLAPEAIERLLRRACSDPERGLGGLELRVDEEAFAHLAQAAGGDARRALNALEIAAGLAGAGGRITVELAEQAIQRRAIRYDREGDQHYDVISAFIKSMRGSDPDAAVYWLARMLAAGEDPRFVARRLIIHAAEDVGNADPVALLVATAAAQAVEYVGLPEARIPLAQAAIYIACAPKSNAAYRAIGQAMGLVEQGKTGPVPRHLRDASYGGAERLGHGVGYRYPHDYPGHWVVQQYLPEGLEGTRLYEPSDQGREREIRSRLEALRRAAAAGEAGGAT